MIFYKAQLVKISCLFALVTTGSVANESNTDYKEQVLQALQQVKGTSHQDWGYVVKRYENEEGQVTSSIEQFRPDYDYPQRWTLVEKNGRKPSEKEANAFIREKQKREKDKSKGSAFKLDKMIIKDTLHLISETPNQFEMGFDVLIERLGDEAQENLNGVLVYNKQENFLQQVRINNDEPFSPMFMVDISQFNLTMNFFKVDNAVLPQEFRMDMKGRMSFITDIDEVSVDTFTDYQFVGESP